MGKRTLQLEPSTLGLVPEKTEAVKKMKSGRPIGSRNLLPYGEKKKAAMKSAKAALDFDERVATPTPTQKGRRMGVFEFSFLLRIGPNECLLTL